MPQLNFHNALYRAVYMLDEFIQGYGRPRLEVEDMAYCAILRAHHQISSRKLKDHIASAYARRHINAPPSFTSLLRWFADRNTQAHLLTLVQRLQAISAQSKAERPRRHKCVNPASHRAFFSCKFSALINEILCSHICEQLESIIYYDQVQFLPKRGIPPKITNVEWLIQQVQRSVPQNIRPELREDICQDILVDVLEGALTPKKIVQKFNKYLRYERKMFDDPHKHIFLSESPFDNENRTYEEILITQ